METTKITSSDVGNFISGNVNYYLGSPPHIKEQAEYRQLLCQPCKDMGKCVQCGCAIPNMFYSPNKEDSAYRWSKMLSSKEWDKFKLTDQYIQLMERAKKITNKELNILDSQLKPVSVEQLDAYYSSYFRDSEFDSPDSPGSGSRFMNRNFLRRLAYARHISATPFRITSGYRTRAHNESLIAQGLKASHQSSHLLGIAADIACTDSLLRFKIVNSLIVSGFTRIGIGHNFIHVDSDATKPDAIWMY